MRWPWSTRSAAMNDAHAALDEVEAEAQARLAEAQRLRDEARREAATQREIRRRNHFGPMITDALRGAK